MLAVSVWTEVALCASPMASYIMFNLSHMNAGAAVPGFNSCSCRQAARVVHNASILGGQVELGRDVAL